MAFPLVNLVCVEPKIGCYGIVTLHFSTLLMVTICNSQSGITLCRAHAHKRYLNRVPEHDCPTFFVLHRTICKPMHSEWERFSDEREKERESVRRQYSGPSLSLYICQYFRVSKQTSSKTETNCSTERAFLRQLTC